MKTKFIVGLALLLGVIIINSCEKKQAALAPPAVLATGCDTTNLTYSSGNNTMQDMINVQCGVNNSSCHPAGGGASTYDYSTYAGIYANYSNGSLYQALFTNGSGHVIAMPLVAQAGWDACTLAKFKAWIDLGCPQ